MKLEKISIDGFKALRETVIEPGKVNVLVGANGSGKSSLLEAIGLLSAAINERVDENSLSVRGVRLGSPTIYKSSFKNDERRLLTIEMSVDWKHDNSSYNYKVNLQNPIDDPEISWQYHSETLSVDSEKRISRGVKSKDLPIEVDKYRGLLSFYKDTSTTGMIKDIFELFNNYGIYTPSTDVLRGSLGETQQRKPIGLHGGRLAEAVEDLLKEDSFGTMDIYDLYDMLNWVEKIEIGKPNKEILPTGVPVPQRVIKFSDKFMNDKRNQLTSYDASEGALYVLFLLSLIMHKDAPKMLAVDNFDQAMNPRLARAVMRAFAEQALVNNRIAFITTHNPLVLDGLDLTNDDIRLFTIDRNRKGYTTINRVTISEAFENRDSLSRMWVTGRLGGVPNI